MKFIVISIALVCISFLILLFLNRKLKPKKKPQDIAIDSITFSSGIILFLYILGMVTEIGVLKEIDEFSLFIALFIGGISLISAVTDKYKNKQKMKKKNGKK